MNHLRVSRRSDHHGFIRFRRVLSKSASRKH
ncbi:Uncharacterised protein [Vibrio cholerae]|nr:Uncharacterised protein [Vibrio cholerae]